MSTRAEIALFGAGIVTTMAVVGAQVRPNVRPKDGYVLNNATAITIAVAVFEPIYGEASVANHKPFKASLAAGY